MLRCQAWYTKRKTGLFVPKQRMPEATVSDEEASPRSPKRDRGIKLPLITEGRMAHTAVFDKAKRKLTLSPTKRNSNPYPGIRMSLNKTFEETRHPSAI